MCDLPNMVIKFVYAIEVCVDNLQVDLVLDCLIAHSISCAKILPIEIARIPMQSTCLARSCKIGQCFYFQIEIQIFIVCDPEGDTKKMSCHVKEQVYLHISKGASSRHYMYI